MHRILIVSEELFLRDMVSHALDGLDADVRCAASSDEAQRLCNGVLFDLVIVLAVTPFSCCCEMLPRRAEGLRRPVVYVIAWQQSEQIVLSLLENGVDQYLTFPVNLHRLHRKVGDELKRII